MVRFLLPRFATSLMLCDRAFNTVHEALTVAGGSCLTRTVLISLAHLTFHIAYKYIMAELENQFAVLYGVPCVIALRIHSFTLLMSPSENSS